MTDRFILAEIWYRKTPLWHSDPNLDGLNIQQTHVHIHNMILDLGRKGLATPYVLDCIYNQMQGENWSPHGEAKPLLARRNIHHTSMSIGDVIVLPDHSAWECTDNGWRLIGKMVACVTLAGIAGN